MRDLGCRGLGILGIRGLGFWGAGFIEALKIRDAGAPPTPSALLEVSWAAKSVL